jgi:hypothetical protein
VQFCGEGRGSKPRRVRADLAALAAPSPTRYVDLGTSPGCLSPIDQPHLGHFEGMKGMTHRDVLLNLSLLERAIGAGQLGRDDERFR